ncbi:MAG: tetratricopeptide repeat protein [Desulfuromonadaceae bacterium]|nr:tetratricopeptide repeat protein [Desulfuromonadaceae bacterium]
MNLDTSAFDKMSSALATQQSSKASVANAALSNGLTLYQKGDYKGAAAAFRMTTAMDPTNVEGYNYLALADQKLGKNKEAIKAYKISLSLDSYQETIHVNLAGVQSADKNYGEAEKTLKAGLRTNPTSQLIHYTLGHVQLQLGKNKEAEASFKQTVRLVPTDGNAYYGLASALNKQGKYSDAVVQLQKAMNLKRDFAPAMSEMAKAYIGLGKNDKAQEMVTKLQSLKTSQADGFATELQALLHKPKMTGVDTTKSSFNTAFGPTTLLAIDPAAFIEPGGSKEMTMTFTFDSAMDSKSVTNVNNWSIGRSQGVTAGLYDNGLYRPTDRSALITMPSRVTYNPIDRSATLYFKLYQDDAVTGTIDTKHLTFSFKGTDVNGKKMDPAADQYNGSAAKPF